MCHFVPERGPPLSARKARSKFELWLLSRYEIRYHSACNRCDYTAMTVFLLHCSL